MFKVALFILSKNWKRPKYSSTGEKLAKLWSIHMIKYCSVTERNRQLVHTVAWTAQKCIMLSAINSKGCVLYDSLYRTFWKTNRITIKTDQWLPRFGDGGGD